MAPTGKLAAAAAHAHAQRQQKNMITHAAHAPSLPPVARPHSTAAGGGAADSIA